MHCESVMCLLELVGEFRIFKISVAKVIGNKFDRFCCLFQQSILKIEAFFSSLLQFNKTSQCVGMMKNLLIKGFLCAKPTMQKWFDFSFMQMVQSIIKIYLARILLLQELCNVSLAIYLQINLVFSAHGSRGIDYLPFSMQHTGIIGVLCCFLLTASIDLVRFHDSIVML